MAETSTNGFDRFNDALRGLDDQIQDLRGRFDHRRKRFEADFRKRADRAEARLRKSPLYRRADRVRKDIEHQLDKTRSQVCDVFGIASKSELEKINRKLNTISKKLNELSREQAAEL